jgi:hypothetical protein
MSNPQKPPFVKFKIFHDVPENAEMALNQWSSEQPDGTDLLGLEVASGEHGKISVVVAYAFTET